ncbi:MAG: helix-turn-helix domain-containing GNAT family N-acetyltransferase [Candidatus Obscuribacterales bacterium]
MRSTQTLAQPLAERVEQVRRFNRFYTRQIGVLREGFLDSSYSLAEVRVLSELFRSGEVTSAALCKELDLDPGYLSRILKKFESDKLVSRKRSDNDGRQQMLSLTELGLRTFKPLNEKQHLQVSETLEHLDETAQQQLIAAMKVIETLLRDSGEAGSIERNRSFVIRQHHPGDMGWVVHRHGALYAKEYNWTDEFEALVAKIVAEFIENYDPACERCWIAERDGEILGAVFLVKKSKSVAQLRLFYVEPTERGQGIGKKLVGECIQFARQCGYRSVVLWTQSNLDAARHIYKRAGFVKKSEEPHHSFGKDLVAETWELALD